MFNSKTPFSYVLFPTKFTFFYNRFNKSKNDHIFLPQYVLPYVSLHVKLSSPFYQSQLVDIFSYETILSANTPVVRRWHPKKFFLSTLKTFNKSISSSSNANVIVYNFHSLLNQNRFYLFILNSKTGASFINSISELFFSANWLEREVYELNGVWFCCKKDVRNLMLPYGDSSRPLQKSFPTIGFIDVFYNPIKDILIQNPISLQL